MSEVRRWVQVVLTSVSHGIPERVHDGGAAPRGPGLLDHGARRRGLAAGLHPVVHEEHAGAGRQQPAADAHAEGPVAVVRRRDGGEPAVAVRGRLRVLPQLDQADPQVSRDQCAQQRASGLRSDDDVGPLVVGEEVGESWAEAPEDARVRPPAGEVGAEDVVRAVAAPAERGAQIVEQLMLRVGLRRRATA